MREIEISDHALYRYIERVLGFDWTEIFEHVRRQAGRTRISHTMILDACAAEGVDLAFFHDHARRALDACASRQRPVLFGLWPAVVLNGVVVTVLDPLRDHHKRQCGKRRAVAA